MRAWSPILVHKIEIHALGFVLRKLQLNRHRDTEVAPHRHAYAQLILYLSGEGVQTVNGLRRPARTGDLFVIPANLTHGYTVTGPGRPVCLVLDYESTDANRSRRALHRRLGPATLNELSQLLARVPQKGRPTLSDYPTILAVVARLLSQPRDESARQPFIPVLEKVRPLLGAGQPLSTVARHAGYHRDHLTRKLKRETGFGLRATRNRMRLEAAQAALRQEASIAEASVKAGFDDPNYFARWFRRQTGQTPSAYLQAR
jgi:AraC-like DNA-binding protein